MLLFYVFGQYLCLFDDFEPFRYKFLHSISYYVNCSKFLSNGAYFALLCILFYIKTLIACVRLLFLLFCQFFKNYFLCYIVVCEFLCHDDCYIFNHFFLRLCANSIEIRISTWMSFWLYIQCQRVSLTKWWKISMRCNIFHLSVFTWFSCFETSNLLNYDFCILFNFIECCGFYFSI